jgi:rhamnopyranosyl-N-acetylglucosaminyl-diphospho-decaprenol beta-1,3/1,4-galactofuranosyltransferase
MLGATDATVTRFRDRGADVDLESGPTDGSARMARSIPEHRREPALTQSVAAVVMTFQRSDYLRVVLQSILTQDRPADEIVVVDNASSDDTAMMLQQEFGTVTHLRPSRNLGPAGSLKIGLSYACERGHRWAWIMQDDFAGKPEALRLLLQTADRLEDDRLGLLGCWFEPVSNHFRFNGALWRNRMVLQELPPVGSPPYLADIMVFKGILVPLAMVEEVGLPCAQYVIMNEEYEYCLRALGRGRRHYILPVPLLLPLEEEAPRGYPAWRGYYQARNRLAMILEHRSVGEFAWWALAQVKYIVAAVVGRDQAWERIRLRLLGAWHALRGVTGITLDQADGGKRLPAPFDVESATVTRNGGCAGA